MYRYLPSTSRCHVIPLSLERERPLAIHLTMAGGKVAKASEGEAAEPTMDEAKAELTGLVKQLGILPLLWGSGKIDFTQEDNVYYLRAGFCVCIGLAYLVTMRAISKVRRRSTMVYHTSTPSHKPAHTACAWCTRAGEAAERQRACEGARDFDVPQGRG